MDEGELGEEISKASNGSSRNLSSRVNISDTFFFWAWSTFLIRTFLFSRLQAAVRAPFADLITKSPSRFFATTEIKLLLVQILLSYDVEPLATRPANRWIADTILPPMEATIKIERQKTGWLRTAIRFPRPRTGHAQLGITSTLIFIDDIRSDRRHILSTEFFMRETLESFYTHPATTVRGYAVEASCWI